MRAYCRTVVIATTLSVAVSSAIAQAPIIYPAKNQTAAQQQKDEGECAAWAKQNTGIDPAVVAATPTTVAAAPPPAAAQPQQTGPNGERVREPREALPQVQ